LLEHKLKTRLLTVEDIEMKSGIYQIKNLTNNKIYIGSSVDIKARWAGHRSDLKNKKHHSKHLQRSWELHGSNAFEFMILEVVKDSELLLEREQHYLDTLRPYEREVGYNNCREAGRPTGYKHSEETRRKMSETKKGHKHSEETKRKIGISQKGKHISDETKIKQSISAKKRWKRTDACTEETRKKMSEAHKGRKPWNKGIKTPQEVKDKISKTLKGRPSPMKGNRHSEETKRLMSEVRSGENNARSIMTWEKVREIRRLYAAGGISQQKLADQFGCSKGCIKHILKNRSWREQ
jgi:group I intron endonuclease